jgi:hypothetical protein
MQQFTRYTVWYCTYGDDRAKPTDMDYNFKKNWITKKCAEITNMKREGNIIDKHTPRKRKAEQKNRNARCKKVTCSKNL